MDIASYITEIAAQLETMAIAEDFDALAYFLSLAHAEADLYVRTNTVAPDEEVLVGDRRAHRPR